MKVLIVDDHALMRDALARVMLQLQADAIVMQAAEPQAALALIEQEPDVDLVLLDLALPHMHGISMLRVLRETHPAICVVVVSATADRDSLTRAFDYGAMGFLPKSSTHQVFSQALRLVLAGGVYIPPEILGRDGCALRVSSEPVAPTKPSDIGLTERQAEILAAMMRGESNKVISRALHVAEPTVKSHVSAILKALNVTSRTQAVLAASKLRLELPPGPRDSS